MTTGRLPETPDTIVTATPQRLGALAERSWHVSCGLGPMSTLERFASLVEEVGELGRALLVRTGAKPVGADAEDIDIAFAGVLFDLLVLACQEAVDVEASMQRGIAMLEQRLDAAGVASARDREGARRPDSRGPQPGQ